MSDGGESKDQRGLVSGSDGQGQTPQKSIAGIVAAWGGLLLWLSAILLNVGRNKRLRAVESTGLSRCSDEVPKTETADQTEPQAQGAVKVDFASEINGPSEVDHLKAEIAELPGARVGLSFAVATFSVSMLAGLAFLLAYWTNQSNVVLGVSLGIFFAGVGLTLVLWSHHLVLQREVIEKREPLAPANRNQLFHDFECTPDQIRRRGVLKWMCAVAGGILAFMGFSLLRSLGPEPNSDLYSTVWKRGQRLLTPDGKPVSIDTLQPGSTAIVFPEGKVGDKQAQTVLVRVPLELLQLPAEREQWAPSGNVAYSRVCTHAGCAVGVYERTNHLLMCPCHQSTFDVLRAAKPTSGPAARPLPQLPLYADADGLLRAGGGFTEPPGPEFWGKP